MIDHFSMKNTSEYLSRAKNRFDKYGFCNIRDVIALDLIQEEKSHIDWLMKKHKEIRHERLHHNLTTHDPFWMWLVSEERLLDIAKLFIGLDITLLTSHYIVKPPTD